MLRTLHISNYALIDSIDICFSDGLNIITGETGAGKSIMLGALSLILGERADAKAVADTSRKSVIEATFETADADGSLRRYCEENDIDWDPSALILRREIAPAGRSRAFINDSPVTLERLRHLAMQMVDIHSQHQNQLLSSPEFQLQVIDSMASNAPLLAEYSLRYTAYRKALRQLHEVKKQLQLTRDDEDYTRYQLEQLDNLQLTEGEQTQLEHERDVLANVTDIKTSVSGALDALYNGQPNAIGLIGETADHIETLSEMLDGETDGLAERLESARIELQDIADTLSAIDSRLAAEPDDLIAVESRLNDIYAMQQKHRVDSVEALIEIRERLRKRLDRLDDADATIEQLEQTARRYRSLARETAKELTSRRTAEAARFERQLLATASPLGMKNLQVNISVTPTELSPTGADAVAFLFAFNKNQQLTPVAGSASGGEISRLMLSIKAIIASRMQLPSIIFDEVDTGVSGDVASRMGMMMQQISSAIQVIAITHLPAVASKGKAHFKVFKADDETSTHTRVRRLDTETERITELALMLSGNPDDPAARAAAKSLLQSTIQ